MSFRALCIATACVAASTGCAAQPAPSARQLLSQAATQAERTALPTPTANWREWEQELATSIPAGAPASAAYPAIQVMIARYGDPHAKFVPAPSSATSQAAPAAPAAPTHPPIPEWPEGRMLRQRVAYLVLPQCPMSPPDVPARYARTLRAAIARLEADRPEGWIVDLRLNGGGNIWPMLVGMWPLLGDGVCATSLGQVGVTRRLGCSSTQAWIEEGGTRTPQLDFAEGSGAARIASRPCALLIGGWTMSSGELLAGAFRTQPQVRLFGEPTAGLTTGTQTVPLDDGSLLIVPVDTMGDRNGATLAPRLSPQVPIPSSEWPSAEDPVAAAALLWIARERHASTASPPAPSAPPASVR